MYNKNNYLEILDGILILLHTSNHIFQTCIFLRRLQFLSQSEIIITVTFINFFDHMYDRLCVFIIYTSRHNWERFFLFFKFQRDFGFFFLLQLEIKLMLHFAFKFCLSQYSSILLCVINVSR